MAKRRSMERISAGAANQTSLNVGENTMDNSNAGTTDGTDIVNVSAQLAAAIESAQALQEQLRIEIAARDAVEKALSDAQKELDDEREKFRIKLDSLRNGKPVAPAADNVLVRIQKNGVNLLVHPTTVAAHKSAGWKIG